MSMLQEKFGGCWILREEYTTWILVKTLEQLILTNCTGSRWATSQFLRFERMPAIVGVKVTKMSRATFLQRWFDYSQQWFGFPALKPRRRYVSITFVFQTVAKNNMCCLHDQKTTTPPYLFPVKVIAPEEMLQQMPGLVATLQYCIKKLEVIWNVHSHARFDVGSSRTRRSFSFKLCCNITRYDLLVKHTAASNTRLRKTHPLQELHLGALVTFTRHTYTHVCTYVPTVPATYKVKSKQWRCVQTVENMAAIAATTLHFTWNKPPTSNRYDQVRTYPLTTRQLSRPVPGQWPRHSQRSHK